MQNQVACPASFLTADSLDEPVDRIIATHELTRRKRCDEIKAEYRAGLVAGGQELDGDWLQWFAKQIRLWPNEDAMIMPSPGSTAQAFANKWNDCPVPERTP